MLRKREFPRVGIIVNGEPTNALNPDSRKTHPAGKFPVHSLSKYVEHGHNDPIQAITELRWHDVFSRDGERLVARLGDLTAIGLSSGRSFLRGSGIAKTLETDSVLTGEPGSGIEGLGCLLQFLLYLIQINQCATDFFSQNGILLQKICALSPHAFEQRAQDIEVTVKPTSDSSEHPNPIFLRPPALTVNLP
jgi:hypothetical protein